MFISHLFAFTINFALCTLHQKGLHVAFVNDSKVWELISWGFLSDDICQMRINSGHTSHPIDCYLNQNYYETNALFSLQIATNKTATKVEYVAGISKRQPKDTFKAWWTCQKGTFNKSRLQFDSTSPSHSPEQTRRWIWAEYDAVSEIAMENPPQLLKHSLPQVIPSKLIISSVARRRRALYCNSMFQ